MPNIVITSFEANYTTQLVAGHDGIEVVKIIELKVDLIELTDEETGVLMAVASTFGEEAALAVLGL